MPTELLNKVKTRSKPRPQKFQVLLEKLNQRAALSPTEEDFLWEVYLYARDAHRGQRRQSGESYFEHPYQTALILADLHMDPITIAGGFLHDVIEDTNVNFADIAEKFGDDVAQLVEGVTKISGITFRNRQEEQADNFRKMLLSVATDIRVLIIKLADRLHNMQTLSSLPPIKQRRIAIETRDVYAPLAHRLGMFKLKSEMEDLVLKALDPDAYQFLEKKISEKRSEREKYIRVFTQPIEKALAEQSVKAQIFGRPKNFYSIYKKMKIRNKPFEEIYDLLAIRIIVDNKENCYAVLGIVHDLFIPVMDRFKDYIANHKVNFYQSIHTTVFGPSGRMVEIQIRTTEMNDIAEEGIAAHWRYKEGRDKPDDVDKYVKWLRDLIEVLQTESSGAKDFMDTLKIDLFKDEIFVFTPMGDLIRLPKGATPVDFAYEVHTEIGARCIGAKVDGKMVPLNSEIRSGQTIEIITSETHRPSYAWLKFVTTSKAIGAIKRYLRKTQFEESITLGKEILEKENQRNKTLRFLKTVQDSFEDMGFSELDKLYAAVGSGVLTVPQIYAKLFPQKQEELAKRDIDELFIETARKSIKGIKVQGISNLMVSFAKCCNPIPGDEILGFVSRGRGVIVHRNDCTNIPSLLEENERLLDVEWDIEGTQAFLVKLKIMAQERKKFLKDVTDIMANTDTNIISIDGDVDESIIHLTLVIQVENLRHLNKIFLKLQNVQGIISVERK
ncbi:MAG: bifunctional (p)ppGpp synthetase/guanosine-3',5'-bis(diphosphate) 3'-pyrophosphohydrolase [Candidatus Marinimicrobia bacterium]|nr:bifunctional (p)ppGpp synthetase/guanosine-3',5'-bis(diphosphate) 3'-pyrophosphohydrolase [Candidatus Neomarinimicrobiota bacterium]MCK9483739.1 bifunctional (p)ppGpp synthetase/guanosine-3',5'-bis(diphosphate) 3'-pyrophosphohydrolase [Candidatus Neomarinimicrobiota bacterium]MDD5060826.1 bifunctional (p)ppGpp synthetase/guanosine-3',5'-bis(diphosphate) 3'-pyrophosphohydrolase [Candidatus Neomarinimicrobiota bacterium]